MIKHQRQLYAAFWALFVCSCSIVLVACSDDHGPRIESRPQAVELEQGVFSAGRISGLRYSSPSAEGTTDAEGRFAYGSGETVSFSVGELEIGAAKGRAIITVQDLFPDAQAAADPRVDNLLALLQTLDQDGDLNNGIRISAEIAAIVSEHKHELAFDRTAEEFANGDATRALLDALNAAQVFSDTDPRARTLRGTIAAREYTMRASAERKLVATEYGDVRGFAANASTWQWLGIPYAKPPLGSLRWKPPEEPASWAEPRDAIAWSDQAPQDPRFESSGEGGMSEDCLYLNVTAPANARNLPVMVWFHGGAFTILTGNSRAYNNADGLPAQGVVLVTVNHRLGPFGYVNHPLLVADSSYGGSGNYGQLDLVRALQWVKNNISGFGGDPGNVMIFGQSGGCGKVASLMISPLAADLFHKAACQSGSSAVPSDTTVESSIAAAEVVGKALFMRIGASTVEEARALPWTAVVQADIDNDIPRQTYRPSIDNYYLSKTMHDAIVDGQPNDVPLLIGATNGDYPSLRAGLRDVMPFRSQYSKSPLYVYKFSRTPAGWAERGILSGHGGELPYLFNYPPMFVSNYLFDLVEDPATGGRPEIGDLNENGITGTDGDRADILSSQGWNEDDTRFANLLKTVWTKFAATGVPNSDVLSWPAYTAENDTYVEFGPTNVQTKTGLAAAFP
jgi:para-nitrobenzyl esterase